MIMFEKSFETVLNEIIQLDIDASFAYLQAIEAIEEDDIRINFMKFQNDHLRHIKELSAAVIKLGGIPPEHTKDFKGYLIEGITNLRSITGSKGALKAMKTNEKMTNYLYKNALNNKDMPVKIQLILQQNYHDAERHLQYIEDVLEQEFSDSLV